MRVSQLFTKTRKEAPADETAKNAQLLIRAGYVHKEMAGVYDYLPLGKRVLDKIAQIIREEMNRVGGLELQMSVLQPKELWEKTDRWSDDKVDNWFKTKLSNGSDLGVGLTHEEPIVGTLLPHVKSHKDLPVMVYQIQNKFRNELRARSGILRGREFVMKDLYSFARSEAEHEAMYEKIAEAYLAVYRRLGLGEVTFRTKADGGIFTEKFSDEYQTVSPIGEDVIFSVPGSDIVYNQEVAPAKAPALDNQQPSPAPFEEVETPGATSAVQLAKDMGVAIESTTKTMIYQTDDGRLVAAAVRGDYEINEIKLRKTVRASDIKLADAETVKRITGAEVGYAGLLNLPDDIEVVVDDSCRSRNNFEMGANRTDYHYANVNWGRDLPEPEQFYDIKQAKGGDIHPESGKVYELKTAVEVGNIFPLETKYTEALGLRYTDPDGNQQPIVMGSYGIGVSRLMGVIAEHFADDKGLVWPEAVAPFKVYLVSIGEKGSEEATRLYEELSAKGIEVFYDDRSVRPGEKFADAELIGLPHRVTVSERSVEAKKYEYTKRSTGKTEMLTRSELLAKLG